MSLASKKQALQIRAHLFSKVRSFFSKKGVLEVDTPVLSHTAPIDEHIEIISCSLGNEKTGYLHSSPEYAMKRLLASGIGDIYQMSHVFRKEEEGALHNPEFTMVEWYRLHTNFPLFIEETIEFIALFLQELPVEYLSYKEAFKKFTGLDYRTASVETLLNTAQKEGLSPPQDLSYEEALHFLMGFIIEPKLGRDGLSVLMDYPSSQAALAKVEKVDGELVARRFEVYYKGIELANGYLELTDPVKQRERLLDSLDKRKQSNKPTLPIDEHFLQALEEGIPPCCGVAVGFDRLLLLKIEGDSLKEVLPMTFSEM